MSGRLKIEWLGHIDTLEIRESDLQAIDNWITANSEEIHEICHFVRESETEAVKIIDGKEAKHVSGQIVIDAYEILFYPNIVLVVRSKETQYPDKCKVLREVDYLGELMIACE